MHVENSLIGLSDVLEPQSRVRPLNLFRNAYVDFKSGNPLNQEQQFAAERFHGHRRRDLEGGRKTTPQSFGTIRMGVSV